MAVKVTRQAALEEPVVEDSRLRIWLRKNRDAIVAWTFLTPMVIYFSIMTFVPMVFLIVVSFMEWNIVSLPTWTGLANFKVIFSSYQNWFYPKVIGRTLLYAGAILSLNIVLGFFIALVLNQNLRFKGLFRTLWYLPSVFGGAVIALLLRIYLQGSSQGVLNLIIGRFGVEPIDWIRDPLWMPIIGVLFVVWQNIGFTVIFFLAGLQGIDENLYDAAKMDGANSLQLLSNITIPQMVPVLLFISVTGLINSMQMWEVPSLITGGGPNDMTYTLVYSIQSDSFRGLEVGLGTAQSLVLFVMLLVFIGWQLNEYRKQYSV
jgi:ABC-type sugar transport system permease subunit